jgi:uncharacterized membrane protein
MDWYFVAKTLHILSAAILFGTGAGIAFFMWQSRHAANPHERHFASRQTVLADFLFTLPAVIVQPLTGIWLIQLGGHDPAAPWLVGTYALYALAGACWLPVVGIQIRLKTMAGESVLHRAPLPDRYHHLFRIWFLLGWPAFISVIVIFWLMVAKPL